MTDSQTYQLSQMKKDKNEVLNRNKTFYESLYQQKSSLSHLIRMRISFDQQSKARINRSFINSYLEKMECENVETTMSLLDFGSGWGAFLMKMPRNMRLYCFDLSFQAMQSTIRASKYLGYHVKPAGVENDEIVTPKDIDVIVCSHVLEHVEDDERLLGAFNRALKEGGLLLINVPINEIWDDPKHLRAYNKDGLVGLLEKNGFENLEVLAADKWTGYLIEKEFLSRWPSRFSSFFCKTIRALLAISPMIAVRWSEEIFFRGRECNQLLSISRKVVG